MKKAGSNPDEEREHEKIKNKVGKNIKEIQKLLFIYEGKIKWHL
jgi:hypothetical protein